MKAIKPYYRRGYKFFYKKGKKRMTITRTGVGCYLFNGDMIDGRIEFPTIKTDINCAEPVITIRTYK